MSRARARRATPGVVISTERTYEVLRRPVVTEKSTMGADHNQVTFKVSLDATKPEIGAAVETIFGVKVKAVNTVRQVGKNKRFRGRLGRRSDYKKAIVTLEAGHNIDVIAGI